VSFYDGLYAALAVPLVTADQQLARAPGFNCTVEQIGPA
jgi:predicted nucleic acid-binding protein